MSQKTRLLFDANPLVRQKTGVGFYTKGVIEALTEIPELELRGHFFRGLGVAPELPSSPNLHFSSNSWLVGQSVKALRKVGIRLPWELLAGRRADVLLFPDFTSWPSLFGSPKVLTVHDLTFIDHPEYVQEKNLRYLRRYVKHDAQRASLVLTVSDFSRQRIIEVFGLPPEKVLAEPIPPPQAAKATPASGQPSGFILYIGTVEPRKNVAGLVEGYLSLPPAVRSRHRLVLAGGQGWQSENTIARIQELESQGENIVMTGYVSDQQRASLYKEAAVVVVPSIYEGFGMPILEAMSYGTPVAVSDIPVFKEVAGQAALYFDPNSDQSIKNALAKVLSDKALAKRLSTAGSNRLKDYSWQTVAQELYAHIRELVA